MALVGALALIGLTVNPAILLVDRMQQHAWKGKMTAGAAALAAVRERARPVLMTATTTIAGLWPLVSVRSAEYLANELPDVVIPEPVLERMRAAESRSPEAARVEGVAIALEVYHAIRDVVDGVQVATPLRGRASTLEVLAEVRA